MEQRNDALYEIEKINMDYIRALNSREYILGDKILQFQNNLKKNNFSYFAEKILCKKRLNSVKEKAPEDNWSEDEWKSLLHCGPQDKKIVIYSCITGGYDSILDPMYFADNIEYRLLTDGSYSCKWNQCPIPDFVYEQTNGDLALINRYVKFHPHELFGNEFDFSIYIDGNIQVVSDLSVFIELMSKCGISMHTHCTRECIFEEEKACQALKKGNSENINLQVESYRDEGFPANYGMVEGNLIVTDLRNSLAKKICDECWNELLKFNSGRDQIGWPYVLWKNGINVADVAVLGNNIYRNPKLRVVGHANRRNK